MQRRLSVHDWVDLLYQGRVYVFRGMWGGGGAGGAPLRVLPPAGPLARLTVGVGASVRPGFGYKDKLGKRHVAAGADNTLLSTVAESWASCLASCRAHDECDWATWDFSQCYMYGGWFSDTTNDAYDSFFLVSKSPARQARLRSAPLTHTHACWRRTGAK